MYGDYVMQLIVVMICAWLIYVVFLKDSFGKGRNMWIFLGVVCLLYLLFPQVNQTINTGFSNLGLSTVLYRFQHISH